MASFYIWETVDYEIELQRESGRPVLEGCKEVIISLGQRSKLVEKDSSSPDLAIDYENDIIIMHLSQEDTGKFREGEVIVQANFLYEDTERDTSAQDIIQALSNLHRKVMR